MVAVNPPRSNVKFRRRLTDAEMDRVLSSLRLGGRGAGGPALALVALWDVILGDAEDTTYADAMAADLGLHPRCYAIPADQGDVIVAAMQEGRSARVRREVAFTWFNSGPATYRDE